MVSQAVSADLFAIYANFPGHSRVTHRYRAHVDSQADSSILQPVGEGMLTFDELKIQAGLVMARTGKIVGFAVPLVGADSLTSSQRVLKTRRN